MSGAKNRSQGSKSIYSFPHFVKRVKFLGWIASTSWQGGCWMKFGWSINFLSSFTANCPDWAVIVVQFSPTSMMHWCTAQCDTLCDALQCTDALDDASHNSNASGCTASLLTAIHVALLFTSLKHLFSLACGGVAQCAAIKFSVIVLKVEKRGNCSTVKVK